MDLHELDPTNRFTSRVDAYRKYRPDYPDELIDTLVRETEGAVVDLGSGTGIGAIQLARRGRYVIGIEPNVAMRRAAPEHDRVEWREGTAEATGLEDGAAGLVTAFQAWHWFDPGPTLIEISRILRPGGLVAAIWNERDEADGFTRAYGELVREVSENHPAEARVDAARSLEEARNFVNHRRRSFSHGQRLDLEGLKGRAASTSYLPGSGPAHEALRDGLDRLFAGYGDAGYVTLRYETVLVSAVRP